MNKILIFVTVILLLVFSGCSTKKVYEPTKVDDEWEDYGSKYSQIVGLGSNIALLEDNSILTKDGVLDIKIDKKSKLITMNDGWIITAKLDGNLTLIDVEDSTKRTHFSLLKTIVTANVKDNILAVIFADSEMALYDLDTKELLFKEQGSKFSVADARVTPPYFMNDLVLFSTLDGKVIIINTKLKKKLRTVIVSSEDNFNNIIYFNVIDNKIIAATGTKILSLSSKEIRAEYEIRSIVYDGNSIFLATKQGEIVSLTPNLELNAKIKFPFAHALSIIAYGDKIYLLEKEGYLIIVDKDLQNYSVHEMDVSDGYIFLDDKTFYLGDEYISVD